MAGNASGTKLWATCFVTLALLTAKLVAGCGVSGQIFCDKCGEGSYTSGKDSYLSGVTVSTTCVVSKGGATSNFTGSGTTDANGNFLAAFSGTNNYFGQFNADLAFMFALFKFGGFLFGRNNDAEILGCQVTITKAPSTCSQLGSCGGHTGTGWYPTAALGLGQSSGSSYADVLLGSGGSYYNSMCLKPATKDASCPVVKGAGDPHYTGADGSHFDFSGEPDANFCLLSDAHLHINAYYGGRFGEYQGNPHKALTWMRQLGIMWGHHTIVLAAREGARWQYDNGYMARIEVNGDEVVLSQAGDSATFADGQVELTWLAAKHRSADDLVDIYEVKIGGVLSMRATLRPEVAALRTNDDAVIHFDFEIPQVDVSDNAHGVLGQTFRADRQNKLAEQKLVYSELLHTQVIPGDNAEGFLDGVIADYRSSGLLKADCRVAHFARAYRRDAETAQAIELATGAGVSTVGLTRKMLRVSAISSK